MSFFNEGNDNNRQKEYCFSSIIVKHKIKIQKLVYRMFKIDFVSRITCRHKVIHIIETMITKSLYQQA